MVDGQTSMITSANLDRRSFELNLEASLVVYDDATSAALRRACSRSTNRCVS